jgi:cytosine/adenosine deaminase-related metal-dependent hydrolase
MKIVAASYLLPVSAPPVEGGAMVVDKGRIVAVGGLSHLRSLYSAPVQEFPGCVIMPGFVNAHSHLELTHFPSWKIRKGIDYEPRTYVDWVIQVIKINRSLTHSEKELSLHEGIRISLESGTTAIGDIVSDVTNLPVYRKSVLSGRAYLEAIGQDPLRCTSMLERLKSELLLLTGSPMLPGLSPHAPHTLSEEFFKEVAGLAVGNSIPMTIHVAESREEMDFLFDSKGKIAELLYPHVGWQDYIPAPRKMTPVEYLDALGVLDRAPTAVHCVHVNGADVEILKKRGVRVVLCPRSNEKLDVGKAPAYLFKKAGIALALGTDSLASNDSLSMQDEMTFVAQNFEGVFTADEILRMATLGGAEAIRMDHETGSLEEGKRADFLVMSLEKAAPEKDLPSAILEEGKLQEVATRGEFLPPTFA